MQRIGGDAKRLASQSQVNAGGQIRRSNNVMYGGSHTVVRSTVRPWQWRQFHNPLLEVVQPQSGLNVSTRGKKKEGGGKVEDKIRKYIMVLQECDHSRLGT